jgi:hypothetical protein
MQDTKVCVFEDSIVHVLELADIVVVLPVNNTSVYFKWPF